MRKATSGFENIFFLCVAIVILFASVAAELLHTRIHFHNDRVQYGMDHLPVALFSVFLFTVLVGVLPAFLSRWISLEEKPTSFYVAAIVVLFCIFWLPVFLSGGFVEDDWMLLSAASIRKIIYLHPAYSWHALDSVDGNFRPLGTVLYFAFMLKLFGVHAHAFLMGNFIINLLGSLIAFFIVRELGYSRVAGAAASMIYISRDLIYTENAWVAALGDATAILLCGLTVLAVLRAMKQRGLSAFVYHAIGWGCFCLATLAKQSSFAAPAIVAILLFMRPGDVPVLSLGRRVKDALIALLVYGGTAGIVFYHAKILLQTKTPYPLTLGFDGLVSTFAYVTWYFATIVYPSKNGLAIALPIVVGLAIVIGLVVIVRRVPRVLGDRPRDVVFLLLAALASLSLLIPLGARVTSYYGSMFAFWLSIALGIALTRFGTVRKENRPARIACFVFCLLVAVGFLDVRVKQTALIPSGGYIWGTFGMDRERSRYEQLSTVLSKSPHSDTLVLVDFPAYPSYYASMAFLIDPAIRRILAYDSTAKTYLANDLQGDRPRDEFDALNDTGAFNWKVTMSPSDAAKTISTEKAAWIRFSDNKIEPWHPIGTP